MLTYFLYVYGFKNYELSCVNKTGIEFLLATMLSTFKSQHLYLFLKGIFCVGGKNTEKLNFEDFILTFLLFFSFSYVLNCGYMQTKVLLFSSELAYETCVHIS